MDDALARGRFITFEGGEGAGKSTHVRRLAARLAASGIEVVATREPGGTAAGERIRALLLGEADERWDPLAEALLHFAARREHVAKLIGPALARGAWVISDRFADSTMVYQGYAQGAGREAVEALARLCLGSLRPDLTLVLDLPEDQGLARAGRRGETATRYERMAPDFHRALRAGFLDIARREPERCVVLDATRPVEEVADAVFETVRTRLGIDAGPA